MIYYSVRNNLITNKFHDTVGVSHDDQETKDNTSTEGAASRFTSQKSHFLDSQRLTHTLTIIP